MHYKLALGDDHPDEGKPFAVLRLDNDFQNELFCMSNILFTNPSEAPEDEVALVCFPEGEGIMMEWERPISMFFPLNCDTAPTQILCRPPVLVLFEYA